MRRRALPLPGLLVVAVAIARSAPAAHAAPALGMIESWPDSGNIDGWGGGATYANPGHGGVGGPDDGYLAISLALAGNLGTRSNFTTYAGDWIAAGITHVTLWLNDIGNPNPLEIHFSLGAQNNRWQYNVGFAPPNNQWAMYTVDLTDTASWTQTIAPLGGGSYSLALHNVQVVNVRHDLAPFTQNPDDLAGDFGLDELLLTATTGVSLTAAGPRPVLLRAPAPNPARAPLSFSFRTFDDGPVRLRVVDAAGRLVRAVDLGPAPAGERRWSWDGLDGLGQRAGSGVYRVRVEGQAGGMSRPVVLLR